MNDSKRDLDIALAPKTLFGKGGLLDGIEVFRDPAERHFVPYHRCQDISEGLLVFCDERAKIAAPWAKDISIGVDEISMGGTGERIVTVMFLAERNVDWYKSLGLLCTVLAKNPSGKFPRKVDLKIEYNDAGHRAPKYLLITIVVHLYINQVSYDNGETVVEEQH